MAPATNQIHDFEVDKLYVLLLYYLSYVVVIIQCPHLTLILIQTNLGFAKMDVNILRRVVHEAKASSYIFKHSLTKRKV